MDSHELAHYVEAALAEGQLESHGAFTLALRELVQKLGSHGLYHWANWSLFLVRGLVRLGCHSLHLHQKGEELWLLGHAQTSQPLWAEMQALSVDQVVACQSAAALMARALGALVPEHVEQACLMHWQDGEMQDVLQVRGDGGIPKLKPTVQRQGWSLGLFVHLRSKLDLAEHLGYAVQYCPVPFVYHKAGWFDSDAEVRGKHWLNGDVTSTAYPPGQMAGVKIPLCCDVYQAGPGGGVLLKPCGGREHAQSAAWSERGGLDWLAPPDTTSSISSLGRYFWGELGELQKLSFLGTRKFMNSSWGDKNSSQGTLTTCAGSHILLISLEDAPDQVVPILDGVALGAIRGGLEIPGLTLIVTAPDVGLDLSGLQLVQSEALREWLQSLRRLVKAILEEVTEVPPETSVVLTQPSLPKVMAATGGACLLVGALTLGVHPLDIFLFSHGGAFGGTAVAGALRMMRKHLPRRWQEHERQLVISTLKKRLRDARQALHGHAAEG